MSLNEILKRLLGNISGKRICTKLERSGHYLAKLKAWEQDPSCPLLTSSFYKAYHYKKAGIQCSYRVELIQEEHREGVVLFYTPEITPVSFSFLFDLLRKRVLQLGYQLRNADQRNISHAQYKQLIETYYLTPLPCDLPGTNLCNQLYGNIVIEYTRINKLPGYIRLMAVTYADAHFSASLPFSELLTKVLHPTEA